MARCISLMSAANCKSTRRTAAMQAILPAPNGAASVAENESKLAAANCWSRCLTRRGLGVDLPLLIASCFLRLLAMLGHQPNQVASGADLKSDLAKQGMDGGRQSSIDHCMVDLVAKFTDQSCEHQSAERILPWRFFRGRLQSGLPPIAPFLPAFEVTTCRTRGWHRRCRRSSGR